MRLVGLAILAVLWVGILVAFWLDGPRPHRRTPRVEAGRRVREYLGTWPLVHRAPDGEELEFLTSWEWPAGEVAVLIGEIEALPEAAGVDS